MQPAPDAGLRARAGDIRGRLLIVFGSQDPVLTDPAIDQAASVFTGR